MSTFGIPPGVDDMNTAVPRTRCGGLLREVGEEQLVGDDAAVHLHRQLDAAAPTTSS